MIENKLSVYLDAIAGGLTKYSPQALDFAVRNQQWVGIGNLLTGFLLLLPGVVVFIWLYRKNKKGELDLACEVSQGLTAIITGCMALISLIFLLDIWNWVAVFSPKTALAHEVVGKLLAR